MLHRLYHPPFIKHMQAKSIYPALRRLCTAELYEYLVNIPCDPLAMIQADYGQESWFKMVHQKNYNYVSSPYNVVIFGKWTPQEWDGGEVFESH